MRDEQLYLILEADCQECGANVGPFETNRREMPVVTICPRCGIKRVYVYNQELYNMSNFHLWAMENERMNREWRRTQELVQRG